MKETRALVVALLCSGAQSAKADAVLSADSRANQLCRAAESELTQVGIAVSKRPEGENVRRARRRAFAKDSTDALLACRGRPGRIEVYYPDGSRLGTLAFTVPADADPEAAAVEASERVRSERYVADVAVPAPYSPPVWWLGFGVDALLSPGGIAPLALITIDAGYRFHRHWSAGVLVSVQPYMRRLEADGLQTRLRVDQLGVAVSYHPLVLSRVDLALGARVTATRIGARGTASQEEPLAGRRDSAWVAFPAARLTLRFALHRVVWLRLQGEVGAVVPKVAVSSGSITFGTLGSFAAQTGLALEAHFR